MGFIEIISKKTSFTVAVTSLIILFASIAAATAFAMIYFLLKDDYMELFKYDLYQFFILAPPIMGFHLLLVGLLKPFTLKSLRPINDNIIGEDLRPGISIKELQDLLSAIKKFPGINGFLAGLSCLVLDVIMLFNTWRLDYEIQLIVVGAVVCVFNLIVYALFTAWYTDNKCAIIRKNALNELNFLKSRKSSFL